MTDNIISILISILVAVITSVILYSLRWIWFKFLGIFKPKKWIKETNARVMKSLALPSNTIEIERRQVWESLFEFSQKGNGLVLGAPGSGKTHSLIRLNKKLEEKGIPRLIIPLDRFGLEISKEIQSFLLINEPLEKKLKKILKASDEKGVLILDGFDATRELNQQERILNFLKDLIQGLEDKWNILVSIRSFDAEKSGKLLKLFPKCGNSRNDNFTEKHIDCRNFCIPLFDEQEVQSFVGPIDVLKTFYEQAESELRKILRNPFNLWILQKLLEKTPSPQDLNAIASEVQLLDKFWKHYIGSSDDFFNKESFLTEITKKMVDRFSLSCEKSEIPRGFDKQLRDSLFSDEILQKSDFLGQRILFSHNILFDYAVAKLAIGETPEEFVQFLEEDLKRSVFLRPSLVYYCAHLWLHDPNLLWKSFQLLFASSHLKERSYVHIIPASAIVNLIKKETDFDPILSPPPNILESVYVRSVILLLQAYHFRESSEEVKWSSFLDKLADDIKDQSYAWYILKVSKKILDSARKSLGNQKAIENCGSVGRKLFSWVWKSRADSSKKNHIDRIGIYILEIVVKTFSTNKRESEQLIRQVLDIIDNEKDFPIEYISVLTALVSDLWSDCPDLVEDIYKVIFGYTERSDEKTDAGTIILNLSSTRKQDFGICQYRLTKKFKDFIEDKPEIAIRTAIACLNEYAWREHISKGEEKIEFNFRSRKASYMPDRSYSWDGQRAIRENDSQKMASTLFEFLEKISTDTRLINTALDMFAENAFAAFLWKRLLKLGSEKPKEFAPFLYEMCIAKEIICRLDIIYGVINFLKSSLEYFEPKQKEKIQEIIMSMSSDEESESKKILYFQKKFVSALPKDLLTNSEAIKLKEKCIKEGETPNQKPFEIKTTFRPYTDDDHLRNQGTDTGRPEIRELQKACKPLSEFNNFFLNTSPTKEQRVKTIDDMDNLYKLLSPQPRTEDKHALDMAWHYLGDAAGILAKCQLEFKGEEYQFVKKILLECCKVENLRPSSSANEEASCRPSNFFRFAGTDAAEGLPWLARMGEDEDILSAISDLLKNQLSSVRYFVSREIWRLYKVSPDFMWKAISERAKKENHPCVLAALNESLQNCFSTDKERSILILKDIFNKLIDLEDENNNIEETLYVILGLYLDQKDQWAEKTISDIKDSPFKYIQVLDTIVSHLLEAYLNFRTLEEREDLFQSAKDCLLSIIDSIYKCEKISSLKESFNSLDESEKDKLKQFYSLNREVVRKIYLTLDVCDSRRRNTEGDPSSDLRKKYYFEVKPILKRILKSESDTSEVLTTHDVHTLMELLVGVVQYDVSDVLKMATDLVNSSESTGYNLDSMAMDEVVKLTERILADYKSELQEEPNIQNLLRLLDLFAKTGHDDALKLIWRLDEIYR